MSSQTWGFEHVGGAKRYVRRVYVVGSKGESVQGRLVYDYGEYHPVSVSGVGCLAHQHVRGDAVSASHAKPWRGAR